MTEEIDELRQRKLAELQQQEAEAERQRQMLQQLRKGTQLFLTQAARDRLDNLSIVRPDVSAQAELMIVKLVQNGQLTRENPMSDQQLLTILRQLTAEKETTIVRK